MSLPIIIGSAVVGGAISALSADREREDALRRIDLITSDLRDAKIDSQEKREMLDQIDDLYNTNLLGELNSSSVAIAALGATNPGSARTEIAGKILGKRSESILKTQQDIERHNRAIESEIVRVQAGVPASSDGWTDFLIGAASLGPVGLGISEGIDLAADDEETNKLLKDWLGKQSKLSFDMDFDTPLLSFNDYLKKKTE